MNKAHFLISLLSVSFFSYNAYSGAGDKGKLYGMANVGASQAALKQTVEFPGVTGNVVAENKKTKYIAMVEAGVGYYLFDSFRTDLSIYYNPSTKYSSQATFNNPTTNDTKVVLNNGISGTLNPQQLTDTYNKTQGVFWNVSYELSKTWTIVPFLSAGVGYLQNEIRSGLVSGTSQPKKKDNYIAYQVGGGAQYNIDYGLDLLVGYKYLKTNKKEMVLKGDTALYDTAGTLVGITSTTFRIKNDPVHSGYIGFKFNF